MGRGPVQSEQAGEALLPGENPLLVETPLQPRRRNQLDDLDDRTGLFPATDPAGPLFEPHVGPRQVVVDDPARPVEVDALSSHVGCQQDARREFRRSDRPAGPEPVQDLSAGQGCPADSRTGSGAPGGPAHRPEAGTEIVDSFREAREHDGGGGIAQTVGKQVELGVTGPGRAPGGGGEGIDSWHVTGNQIDRLVSRGQHVPEHRLREDR